MPPQAPGILVGEVIIIGSLAVPTAFNRPLTYNQPFVVNCSVLPGSIVSTSPRSVRSGASTIYGIPGYTQRFCPCHADPPSRTTPLAPLPLANSSVINKSVDG